MSNQRAAAGLLAVAAVAACRYRPATQATTQPDGEPVDLAGVCPETIVIQTDWFPESEYGAVYNLLGDDYEVDVDNKMVTGSLISEGQPTGVDIEIRAGGAAGSGDVETLTYTDDAITLAFGTTDGQILAWENTPLMSVVAPLEISPLMIMWDPETYPEITSIADLGEQDITINAFGGQTFTTVLAAMGVLSEDQVDPSYDGGPSRFISEGGSIAQQGFVSSEPFLYEEVYEDWLRPVDYELIHDAGFQTYSQTLAIRPDDLETLRACLEVFRAGGPALGGRVRHRSGPHERSDRRHRRALRLVLGLHARTRRVLRGDAGRARPDRQRARRRDRQPRPGAGRNTAPAGA